MVVSNPHFTFCFSCVIHENHAIPVFNFLVSEYGPEVCEEDNRVFNCPHINFYTSGRTHEFQ